MKIGLRCIAGLFAMMMACSVVGCAAHAAVGPAPHTVVVR
jgi:hypothetical protein